MRFGRLLAAGLVLCACTQKAKTTRGDAAGMYTLVAVNTLRIPATVEHEGVKLQVRAGTFTIETNGTCRSRTVFIPPSGVEVTREVRATYTQDGSKLTMRWEGAGMTTGTIEDDAFTMKNEGMVFSYHK
jgi:hypothetical protein